MSTLWQHIVQWWRFYVCYYVLDPTNDKLKRIRIRCNRIRSPRERVKYATLLCSEINRKLYNGWNPLVGEDSLSTKRVSIVEAATNFVRQKEKDLRKDTVRSYRSKLAFFTKWCEKAGISDWLCGRFTSAHLCFHPDVTKKHINYLNEKFCYGF